MNPSTVIGIDPGGNGETGLVVASEWSDDVRWAGSIVLPLSIEAYSVKGWLDPVEIFSDRKCEHAQVLIACEDVAVWDVRGEDVKATLRQVGAFELASHQVLSEPFARVLPVTYRAWWLGGKPKVSADGAIDQALLAAYGGKDAAVGGKKCPDCTGKGYTGRELKGSTYKAYKESELEPVAGGKFYRRCQACMGEKESPRGPLYPLWRPRSLQHCRAALAVAVYAVNNDVWETT